MRADLLPNELKEQVKKIRKPLYDLLRSLRSDMKPTERAYGSDVPFDGFNKDPEPPPWTGEWKNKGT